MFMIKPEGVVGSERSVEFRRLVGKIVDGCFLFPPKRVEGAEEFGILDAVEKSDLDRYLPKGADERMLSGARCLVAIYDELGKEDADQDLIARNIEELKGII